MGCLGTKVYIDVKTYYDAQKRRKVAFAAAGGWLSIMTFGWIFSRSTKQREAREKRQDFLQVFGHVMDVIGKVIDAQSRYDIARLNSGGEHAAEPNVPHHPAAKCQCSPVAGGLPVGGLSVGGTPQDRAQEVQAPPVEVNVAKREPEAKPDHRQKEKGLTPGIGVTKPKEEETKEQPTKRA